MDFHASMVRPHKQGEHMTLFKRTVSGNGFAGVASSACALMAMIGIVSMTGCAAVVDHPGAVAAAPSGESASPACARVLKANWSTALKSTENKECEAKFPEATIYRDDEANVVSTEALQTSKGPQIGLFTPFWVIF
jgi:hypothetical protein